MGSTLWYSARCCCMPGITCSSTNPSLKDVPEQVESMFSSILLTVPPTHLIVGGMVLSVSFRSVETGTTG